MEKLTPHLIAAISTECQTNAALKKLLDIYASKERSPRELEVRTIASQIDVSRPEAINIAQTLANLGCGHYRNGRKGKETRIDFLDGLHFVTLCQKVKNSLLTLTRTPYDEAVPSDLNAALSTTLDPSTLKLTIPQAKAALASSMGIDISSIEITIKA